MRPLLLGDSTERRLLIAYKAGVEMSIIRERFGLTPGQLNRVLKRLGAYEHRTEAGSTHEHTSAARQ